MTDGSNILVFCADSYLPSRSVSMNVRYKIMRIIAQNQSGWFGITNPRLYEERMTLPSAG